jgi:hypothetical protein
VLDDRPELILQNETIVLEGEEAFEDHLDRQRKVERPHRDTRLADLFIELTQLGCLGFATGLKVITRRALAECMSIEVDAKTDAPVTTAETRVIERCSGACLAGNPDADLDVELRERVIAVAITPRTMSRSLLK